MAARDVLGHSGGVAFRCPLLPLATLDRLTGGAARAAWLAGANLDDAVARDLDVLRAGLAALVGDPIVRAALAYASPDLDAALDRGLGDATLRAVAGYVARMSGRAVPFGFFAGTCAGAVDGLPAYDVAGRDALRRRTRLDVAYLQRVRPPDPVLVPNGTAFVAAGRLRLVERDAGGRFHPLAIETDEALDAALAVASGGARRAEIAAPLAGDGVTTEDAEAYVDELVDAQVLVPAVGPAVTGDDPADPLPVDPGLLREVRDLDRGGVAPERLRATVARVAAAAPGLPANRTLHVDTSRPATALVLGDRVLAEAYRAVDVLHPLFRPSAVDADLARFRAAFTARYGAHEVPLLEALDTETGVGFGPPTAIAAAGAPLLDAFDPAPRITGPEWTPIDHHLVDLLSRALRDGAQEIDLGPADLGPLRNPEPRPLPDALAVVGTVAAASAEAVAAGEFRLLVHEVAGPNGAALLSRFADLDPGLGDLVRRHVASEEALRPDAAFAEVVHLPDGRAANVAVRPVLRAYEIPLLGVPGAQPEARVPLSDLLVSVAGDRVVLRSARLGREVLPRVTAAHDYRVSPLPAYRFLAAVAHDGTAASLRWSWGQVQSAPFLPRVTTGRLVLARAQWHWFRADLREIRAARTPAARFAAVQRLRDEWQVPRRVGLTRGDEEIPLDLDGVAGAELLCHHARRFGQVALREQYPGTGDLCVAAPEGRLVHEFVLPLVRRAPSAPPRAVARPRPAAYVPGSEWLAAVLCTGPATADTVLRDVVRPLVAGADAWHFERIAEPSVPYLRVRVHGDPAVLLPRLRELVHGPVHDGAVFDVTVETYRPETLVPQAIQTADSAAVLALLTVAEDPRDRWRAALWGVDRLLADAGLDAGARRDAVRAWRDRLAGAEGETGARAVRYAGRVYRQQRVRLDGPAAAVAAMLDERSAVVAPALGGEPARDDLLAELCSRHVNRMLRAAHRIQELVIYGVLDRAYRARLERAR